MNVTQNHVLMEVYVQIYSMDLPVSAHFLIVVLLVSNYHVIPSLVSTRENVLIYSLHQDINVNVPVDM